MSDKTVGPITSEVLQFLFYIVAPEPFSRNLEIDDHYSIPPKPAFAKSVPSSIDVEGLSSRFVRDDAEPYCAFSPRLLATGEWVDIELGVALARWLLSGKLKLPAITFRSLRLRTADIAGWLLGIAVRSAPERIDELVSLAGHLPTSPDPLSFALFFVQFSHACLDGQALQFRQFTMAHESQLQSLSKSEIVEPEQGLAFLGEEISAFLDSLFDEAEGIAADQNSRNQGLIRLLFSRVNLLAVAVLDERLVRCATESRAQYRAILDHHRVFGAKQYRRLCHDLSVNAHLSTSPDHLKLWQICDRQFRRIFLKRNAHFNIHKDASLRRDEKDAATAEQKYRVFLDTHGGQAAEYEPADGELQVIGHDFATDAQLVTLEKTYSGTFYLSRQEICFNDAESKSISFALADVEMVLWRSCLHVDSGLEFFLSSGRSHFLFFPNRDRARVLGHLRRRRTPALRLLQLEPPRTYISAFTERWRVGQLSNYEYIMIVNLLAGRSFNDLSQYPVFPWVLADYTSEHLDLENPASFRDLSKPIGTLNETRLANLREVFESLDDSMPDRCLYRMHYSTAGYVVGFLVRLEPYTGFHIALQDGKFDQKARLFWSMERAWHSVTSVLPDFRELIPEFFTTPDFLTNTDQFDLGQPQGESGDVALPNWAHGSSHAFVAEHRRALESPYTSSSIHKWLDLIFGVKQRGQAAIDANNVFHPYCYEFSPSDPAPTDPDALAMIQAHAGNFGIIPRQLFFAAHPARTLPPFRPPTVRSLVRVPVIAQLVFVLRSSFILVARDGTIGMLPIRGKSAELVIIARVALFDDSSAFVPDGAGGGWLVAAGPGGFRLFAIDTTAVTGQATCRERLVPALGLACAGAQLLLASWGDSALTLWNLAGGERRIWRRSPHGAPVVAIAASVTLRVVASVDKERRCILMALDTGKIVRLFSVDGEETITKILLAPGGFVVFAGSRGIGSVVKLFDLAARKIAEVEMDEGIVDWALGESPATTVCIAVAREVGGVRLLSVPELNDIADLPLDRRIGTITFAAQLNQFIVCMRDGEICSINID